MKRLAIIGLGPRGLFALENLIIELAKANKQADVLVFETSDEPGSGKVWRTSQAVTNWVNITERALSGLEARPELSYSNIIIEAFPSYHQWSGFSQNDFEADTFPPRAKLGKYLHERFCTLQNSLETLESFRVVNAKVVSIDLKDDKLLISTSEKTYRCDHGVLTIGHQPTELSEQLNKWTSHSKQHENIQVFNDPYPVSQFNHLRNKTSLNIGLRGFGLATIDVMRYLVINNFGNFKTINHSTFKTVYIKTNEQNIHLIPFSLDGLPLAPKPLNTSIDNRYKPTTTEIKNFKAEVEDVTQTETKTDSIDFLKTAITKIVMRVFKDLGNKARQHFLTDEQLVDVISNWLNNADYKHTLLQDETISTYQLIKAYINMALGKTSISLNYCFWQVWRHCQPTFYKACSHTTLDDTTIKAVIGFDERSKRYSYGPPIESMQQVLALVDADILTLNFVNNPDIDLNTNGWLLKNKDKQTIECPVMINSVLDSPKLKDVNSEVVINLLKNDLIQPIHSELGIETAKDGRVICTDDKTIPLAVLGRLAKGSVIGVDAILECFGPRIEDWAKAYVRRLDT